MVQYTRQRVILAKSEVTYALDPVPTGVANTIRCSDITVTPIGGSTVDRKIIYPNFGAVPKALVNKQVLVQFAVELQGSGVVDTPPAYGPLLKACGMSETINAGVSVVYAPESSGFGSCTIYANEAGTLHKLLGARGTVTFDFPPNDLPVMKFSFTGIWTVPAAVALPTPTFAPFIDAVDVNKANTTFSLHGYSAVLERLSVDLGWTVIHRDRPNAAIVQLTDRNSAGSAEFEAPDLGTKDYFADSYNQTLVALNLVHGTTVGHTCTLAAPKVQILQPSYGDVNGIKTLKANLLLTRNAGDDELTLTTT